MLKLSIEKAKPGMIVTAKVTNDKGMVLLPPGTTLTEALIIRLKKWNVQSIQVEEVSQEKDSPVSSSSSPKKINNEIAEKLQKKFKNVLNDETMKTIFKALNQFYQEDQGSDS